jgi:hypothetical protein
VNGMTISEVRGHGGRKVTKRFTGVRNTMSTCCRR